MHSIANVCRGRWRAQPSATKERYGCGPPLAGAHRPFYPVSPNYRACGDTATVSPTAYFFCCARKSRQKDAQETRYIARCRARFFDALFGRRFVTSPIAFNSGKCTTRICGQTASTSVLLISGILGRLRCCTACCRGRWLA